MTGGICESRHNTLGFTVQPVEDTAVREVLDKAKAANCTKSYVIASSGFTRTAIAFAENRPVELIEKQRLETLLTTSSS